MELVRVAALTGYFSVADSLGLDTRPLLRAVGLSRTMFANPEQMLPARAVIDLLERSASLSGCSTFGLRMAEWRGLADLGMVSLLIAHQPTLGDALAVLVDYRNRINSTLVLHLEPHDEVVLLQEEFAVHPPVPARQATDLALGVLARFVKELLGKDWQPHCVYFTYEAPPGPERELYRTIFGCRIEFGAEFDCIVLDRRALDRPNPRADSALAAHARNLVDALLGVSERTAAQQVEQAIMMRLPIGRASIGAAADALGMNLRTLQRRLSLEQTSFSELVERVRARQAARHIANPRLRLTDVADLLGYASLAAFSRWYAQRFGETPSDARRRIRRAVQLAAVPVQPVPAPRLDAAPARAPVPADAG